MDNCPTAQAAGWGETGQSTGDCPRRTITASSHQRDTPRDQAPCFKYVISTLPHLDPVPWNPIPTKLTSEGRLRGYISHFFSSQFLSTQPYLPIPTQTKPTMSPPSSVPECYRPGFLPPSIAKQMQENLPGQQTPLEPAPLDDILADGTKYKAAGKLEGKRAVITGGDSGIGRAVAIL